MYINQENQKDKSTKDSSDYLDKFIENNITAIEMTGVNSKDNLQTVMLCPLSYMPINRNDTLLVVIQDGKNSPSTLYNKIAYNKWRSWSSWSSSQDPVTKSNINTTTQHSLTSEEVKKIYWAYLNKVSELYEMGTEYNRFIEFNAHEIGLDSVFYIVYSVIDSGNKERLSQLRNGTLDILDEECQKSINSSNETYNKFKTFVNNFNYKQFGSFYQNLQNNNSNNTLSIFTAASEFNQIPKKILQIIFQNICKSSLHEYALKTLILPISDLNMNINAYTSRMELIDFFHSNKYLKLIVSTYDDISFEKLLHIFDYLDTKESENFTIDGFLNSEHKNTIINIILYYSLNKNYNFNEYYITIEDTMKKFIGKLLTNYKKMVPLFENDHFKNENKSKAISLIFEFILTTDLDYKKININNWNLFLNYFSELKEETSILIECIKKINFYGPNFNENVNEIIETLKDESKKHQEEMNNEQNAIDKKKKMFKEHLKASIDKYINENKDDEEFQKHFIDIASKITENSLKDTSFYDFQQEIHKKELNKYSDEDKKIRFKEAMNNWIKSISIKHPKNEDFKTSEEYEKYIKNKRNHDHKNFMDLIDSVETYTQNNKGNLKFKAHLCMIALKIHTLKTNTYYPEIIDLKYLMEIQKEELNKYSTEDEKIRFKESMNGWIESESKKIGINFKNQNAIKNYIQNKNVMSHDY